MAAYDDAKFRLMFPYFADTTAWPEPFLSSCWDMASEFISTAECPCRNLNGKSLQLALDLMCAHIAYLLGSPAAGGEGEGASGGGLVTSASIGAVSVSIAQPPVKDGWDYWLNQSPFGQQLLALFSAKAVGGFYVGGLPERLAFRKVGGTFR